MAAPAHRLIFYRLHIVWPARFFHAGASYTIPTLAAWENYDDAKKQVRLDTGKSAPWGRRACHGFLLLGRVRSGAGTGHLAARADRSRPGHPVRAET